ncbi:endo alpha-1,4 polygalactosaminidase [Microbacterium sp.]|uniref:endo alpha-1,4 polygalactosaminidase n=1 Tax=Microbacterium sp. TaxID=51671 RepID=UPI0039E2B1BD
MTATVASITRATAGGIARAAVAIVTATAVLAGCAQAAPPPTPGGIRQPSPTPSGIRLPPLAASPDYQLGGAYPPASGVGVVGRDRSASPAEGRYSICYINGFQTQPDAFDDWDDDLLLRDEHREPVFDPDWPDEALLDTSTPSHRDRIAAMISPWIEGCADAGFDTVEFDNLDFYMRSHGALTIEDNLALAELLVSAAHEAGLAAGQKNAAEDAAALREHAGFDFALTEECAAFRECPQYAAVYGEHVIDIEYADRLPRSFAQMCADDDSPSSMVLRDRDLVTPDDDGYVFVLC